MARPTKIFGIEFVPWNEPLEARLQAIAAGSGFLLMTGLGVIGLCICIYILFTKFWWISVLYFLWIIYDRNSCETGGRPNKWVLNWWIWRAMGKYFPSHLHFQPDVVLDSKKNYLFCCIPHGVIPFGPFSNIGAVGGTFNKLYPEFTVTTIILKMLFLLPISREITLRGGAADSSLKSLNYLLSKPEGGNVVLLTPGGAAEAAYARPGHYTTLLKKRRGFIKVAFKNGAPLVPVITFGETDLYDQIENPLIRKFQAVVKAWLNFFPVFFIGRGIFQYNWGLIPRKVPLHTVVGKPIDVPKISNPSTEEIEELHASFLSRLVALFDEFKYKFVENPENVTLEIL